ncbi:MAG: MBL fold metallo-hydrolase [Cyclobacteriaceae bacterium]
MKSWKIFLATVIPLVWILVVYFREEEIKKPLFMSNPELKTITPHPDWNGTPLNKKGNFVNLYHPFESSFGDLWKWQTSKNPQKKEKGEETRTLKIEYDPNTLSIGDDYLIWLGHATYLIKVNGLVMLTDPVLFDNLFLKRESELPFMVEDLPPIDLLMISHNHRDHCDKKTIQYLSAQYPQMKILTGLKLGDVIKPWTEGQPIEEAGWYQQYNIKNENINITYVPSRHWSRRWLWDLNENLWGGFYIEFGEESIYFMGDSGLGPHFEDIKKTLGKPDHCLMGVGAYKPEWFMSQAHISPSDAIEAFNILEGKYFVPMHFGTFNLSDEPRFEPWDILYKNKSMIKGQLIEPLIGKNLLQK